MEEEIIPSSFLIILASCLFFLSGLAYAFNYFITQFPGNNYFPLPVIISPAIFACLAIGFKLLFGKKNYPLRLLTECIYFFIILSVLCFATNSIQFSPFYPIDQQLISIDSYLGIGLAKLMAWTNQFIWFKKILIFCYSSLTYQMSYLPIILILTAKFSYVREYFALIMISAFFGFAFYYFFPTLGPASFITSPFFTEEQYATGVKFTEIHQYISPSTLEGGLIAMPSFHTIWAWLCLYCARCIPLLFWALLPINILLVCSCVLLGWHYFIDIIGSLIVLLLSHWTYYRLAD